MCRVAAGNNRRKCGRFIRVRRNIIVNKFDLNILGQNPAESKANRPKLTSYGYSFGKSIHCTGNKIVVLACVFVFNTIDNNSTDLAGCRANRNWIGYSDRKCPLAVGKLTSFSAFDA